MLIMIMIMIIFDIIGYPLFASANTGIYPHLASQYHARPKDEFIPWSNDLCHI